MITEQKCPPLSLQTQWQFWAWVYNLQKTNQEKDNKQNG